MPGAFPVDGTPQLGWSLEGEIYTCFTAIEEIQTPLCGQKTAPLVSSILVSYLFIFLLFISLLLISLLLIL
jgi:hypothetical protein